MITDVHHSSVVPADDIARAVSRLKDAAPDIVVLGGDYVSFFDRRYAAPVADLLMPLAGAPHGSFAVLGNHDDEREVPATLATRGFTVLKDQRTALTVRGERLDIAGIRFWTKTPARHCRRAQGNGRHDHPARARPAAADRSRRSRRAAGALGPYAWRAGRRARARRDCRPQVPRAGGLRDPRQHVAVCEPRRRNGLRARADQLPAGRRGADPANSPPSEINRSPHHTNTRSSNIRAPCRCRPPTRRSSSTP